ncbi:MAG: hypothetical protein ABI921_07400 [Panacibacter sp.]
MHFTLLELNEAESIKVAMWTAIFAFIASIITTIISFVFTNKSNRKIEKLKGEILKENEKFNSELARERESRNEREKMYLEYSQQNTHSQLALYADFLQFLVEYNQQLTVLNILDTKEDIETISEVMFTLTATLKTKGIKNNNLWIEENVEKIERIGSKLYRATMDVLDTIKSKDENRKEKFDLKKMETKRFISDMQNLLKKDIRKISTTYVDKLRNEL